VKTNKNKILKNKDRGNPADCRSGIVLLVTLVLLVVLSALGYTLSNRLAAHRHRNQYIIDYQAARYACDSAVKYALAALEGVTPQLISRPNEPDFSDLFALTEVEYNELLAEWAAKSNAFQRRWTAESALNDVNYISPDVNYIISPDVNYIGPDANYISSDANYIGPNEAAITDFNDPNLLVIPGPYGPPWPFVIEPVEFEIGSATVKIEIEDENAKYPIGWALLDEEEHQREAIAGFETFCEWMNISYEQIDSLRDELAEISEIKPFKLEFKPIVERTTRPTRRTVRRGRRATRRTVTVKKTIPASVHVTDFATLFHSSLIDTETLAKPTIVSDRRKESALKYMGMWASNKVNINTAPRHVLEATFTFGGDADKIAEEIMQRRRIEPFADIEDLKKALFRYSDSIGKCEKYITTVSNFFTIKVTAISGVAEASTVIAVTKDGEKIKRIATISG